MVVQAYICQFLQGTKQKNTYSFNHYYYLGCKITIKNSFVQTKIVIQTHFLFLSFYIVLFIFGFLVFLSE